MNRTALTNIAPDIFRKRLLVEGYFQSIMAESVLRDYFRHITRRKARAVRALDAVALARLITQRGSLCIVIAPQVNTILAPRSISGPARSSSRSPTLARPTREFRRFFGRNSRGSPSVPQNSDS